MPRPPRLVRLLEKRACMCAALPLCSLLDAGSDAFDMDGTVAVGPCTCTSTGSGRTRRGGLGFSIDASCDSFCSLTPHRYRTALSVVYS